MSHKRQIKMLNTHIDCIDKMLASEKWRNSFILFLYFTFPRCSPPDFSSVSSRLPCHFYRKIIELQQQLAWFPGNCVFSSNIFVLWEFFFRNHDISNWNKIVLVIFWIIWNQTHFRLVSNPSENGFKSINLCSPWLSSIMASILAPIFNISQFNPSSLIEPSSFIQPSYLS